VLPGFVE
jgi:hypothetical protein